MLIMFLILALVTFGVCTINLSSLNLTENELHLLYVSDDVDFSQDKPAKEQSDEEEESLDFDFEKDVESMSGAESMAEKDAWDKFSKDLEKDGINFNDFDSEEEALNLAKKIYEKR